MNLRKRKQARKLRKVRRRQLRTQCEMLFGSLIKDDTINALAYACAWPSVQGELSREGANMFELTILASRSVFNRGSRRLNTRGMLMRYMPEGA